MNQVSALLARKALERWGHMRSPAKACATDNAEAGAIHDLLTLADSVESEVLAGGSKSEAPTVDELMPPKFTASLGGEGLVCFADDVRRALESALGVRGEEKVGRESGDHPQKGPFRKLGGPDTPSPAPLGESALRAPEPSPQDSAVEQFQVRGGASASPLSPTVHDSSCPAVDIMSTRSLATMPKNFDCTCGVAGSPEGSEAPAT